MKIGNIRMGLATNSSSSHSIIRVPDRSEIRDNLCGEDFSDDCFGFYRDDFVLSSDMAKKAYIASQLYMNIVA